MIKLFFILLLQLSTQYELYKDGNKSGWVSVYKSTIYLQFKGQKADAFKVIFKQRQSGAIVYYIKNELAEGYISVDEFGIIIYLVGNGRRYEEKFMRHK